MWGAVTTVMDRIGLPEHRQILMDKVRSYFNIPSKGVAFVLESEDYPNDPYPFWSYIMAVHLNIEADGVEEKSPKFLLNLMESQDYSHLIWLSKQVCEDQDMRFAWILAHELCHLEQDLRSHALSQAGCFLDDALREIDIEEPKVQNTVPTELDANLKAWRVARKLFGVKVADIYVRNESVGGKHERDFQILLSHNPEKTYDVFGRTISLLRKYQSQLKELQKHSEDNFIANFDIDMVYSELSRV